MYLIHTCIVISTFVAGKSVTEVPKFDNILCSFSTVLKLSHDYSCKFWWLNAFLGCFPTRAYVYFLPEVILNEKLSGIFSVQSTWYQKHRRKIVKPVYKLNFKKMVEIFFSKLHPLFLSLSLEEIILCYLVRFPW